MNLKNISNSLLKISTLVIQFIGGWVDACNSQTSFVWLVTFYAFLALLLPLRGSSLVDGTQSPSVAPVSMPIPSIF